jgi:hypothetical protein
MSRGYATEGILGTPFEGLKPLANFESSLTRSAKELEVEFYFSVLAEKESGEMRSPAGYRSRQCGSRSAPEAEELTC